MTTMVRVHPSAFGVAARRIGDEVAVSLGLVMEWLVGELTAAAGMAGDDEIGAQWGSDFDLACVEVLYTAGRLVAAGKRVAELLEQTGINYDGAEAASGPGDPAGLALNRWRDHRVPSFGMPASAAGDGLPAPPGWGVLGAMVGLPPWPSGHQDRLHAAASALRLAAERIDGLDLSFSSASVELAGEQSPEVGAARAVVASLRGQVAAVAPRLTDLGAACDDYAAVLDQTRREMLHELEVFTVQTAVIEAASAGLAFVTFGISEAAGQAAEAARAAATASSLARLAERLRELSAALSIRFDAVVAASGEGAAAVEPMIAREASIARTENVSYEGAVPAGGALPPRLPSASVPVTAADAGTVSAVGRLEHDEAEIVRLRERLKYINDPRRFDPEVLVGMSEEDLDLAVPAEWDRRPSRKGGGVVFEDPIRRGRLIRTSKGYPEKNRPNEVTHAPYAIVCQNGDQFEVPLAGNPLTTVRKR